MKKIYLTFTTLLLLISIFNNLKALDQKVQIEVLYFHATTRCQGCITIEEFTKNSINTLFEKQLKDSTIIFKPIDFLQPENEHYRDDYKFEVQTLIISKKVNGKEVKWINLDKIWDYSGDYQKFQKYIEKEIKKLKL